MSEIGDPIEIVEIPDPLEVPERLPESVPEREPVAP